MPVALLKAINTIEKNCLSVRPNEFCLWMFYALWRKQKDCEARSTENSGAKNTRVHRATRDGLEHKGVYNQAR